MNKNKMSILPISDRCLIFQTSRVAFMSSSLKLRFLERVMCSPRVLNYIPNVAIVSLGHFIGYAPVFKFRPSNPNCFCMFCLNWLSSQNNIWRFELFLIIDLIAWFPITLETVVSSASWLILNSVSPVFYAMNISIWSNCYF